MPEGGGIPKFPSAEKFLRNIEDFVENYGIVDCVYKQCVEEFSRVEIGQLSERHRVRIVEPFLLTWGRMGRVLGYNGVGAICSKLRVLSEKIEPLRHKNLFSEDINSIRNLVIELYDDLRKTQFKSEKGKEKRSAQQQRLKYFI